MSLIDKINVNSTDYGLRAGVIPYGEVANTSTSTAYTATISGIYEYADGTTIMLRNGVVTSAAGFTIDINGLGAKHCYSNMATGNPSTPTNPTQETTIFNINYTMLFVYSTTVVVGGGWICYRGYDANTNTIAYQVRTNSSTRLAKDKGYKYRLWFTSADGQYWVPANKSSSTNATASRTTNTTPIDPFGPIVYYSYNGTTNASSALTASSNWSLYTLSLGYSFNNTGSALTLTVNKPVYLKCTPQSDGSAVMDYFTQTLPSTADGKIYIFLGLAYSATNIELFMEHPVYHYKNGAIRLWTNAEPLATVATTGSYTDLTDKPTIPSVNDATLTIQKNGTTVNTFTANASSDVTANIQFDELPTITGSDEGKVVAVVDGQYVLTTVDDLDTMFIFPVYDGGIEEITPVNTSTPSTSPIHTTIRYPSQTLYNQYFTYRKSPTTTDGNAKLKKIRGNTVVWNQLAKNGNFVDSSNWTASGGTVAISSNKATITFTSNGDRPFYQAISNKVEGNKVLVIFRAKASVNSTLNVYWGTTLKANISLTTTETEYSFISTVGSGNTNFNFSIFNAVTGNSVTYSNINLFDLTMMFGSGNEPSTVEEFTKLFPLPYYSYDSGSLLSFNGTGIKTTGKNLCIRTNENSNIYNADNLIPVKQGDEIWVYPDYSTTGSDMWVAIYTLPTETNKNNYNVILGYVERGSVKKFTVTEDGYLGIAYGSGVSTYTINKMMIAITSFTVDDYEPYTTSTLSLPTSTYFPTGMKSAGTVYDEISDKRAKTRVGEVDLGTLTWTKGNATTDGTGYVFYSQVGSLPNSANGNNIICASFLKSDVKVAWESVSLGYIFEATNGRVIAGGSSSYADGSAFKTAMNGVYLYYELATPTEALISEDAINNRALSIMMGRHIDVDNPQEAVEIIMEGK